MGIKTSKSVKFGVSQTWVQMSALSSKVGFLENENSDFYLLELSLELHEIM